MHTLEQNRPKIAMQHKMKQKKNTIEFTCLDQPISKDEAIFKTLASKSFAGIYVIQDGIFKFANNSAASCLGYHAEELIGRGAQFFVYPEDLEQVQAYSHAMLRGERIAPYEFRIVTKQGDLRWVMETVSTISYDGRPAILGNSMSIETRKLAEDSLKESEQQLANIIDFLPDSTFAIDRSGKVISWNRAIEEMTGVKACDIVGKGNYEYAIPFYGKRRPILIDLVLKPNTGMEESDYSYLHREGRRLIAETELLSLESEEVFLWGKASPLYDSTGNIVGAIESVRDITEHKRTIKALEKRELDLQAKTSELEDLNAALRVLLKQRDEDRQVVEEKVLANIKLLLLPSLEKLKGKVDTECRSYLNVLESNLTDIVSPFVKKLSTQFLNLTNREMQIANLIKEGLSSKEIATFLNVSEAAVNLHRYRIRKKLNLTKAHNLQSYLSSLS